MTTVDLNADLGESFGRWSLGADDELIKLISSANVACGYHAGDPSTLRSTCAAAVRNEVAIGAQVAYPDLVGFGRRFIDMAADDLTNAVLYQIGALEALARAEGASVRYLKPHGALYNAVYSHEEQAAAVVEAVVAHGGTLPILGLAGSAIETAASERGLRFVAEGFADRAYRADGSLVPRTQPGAVLSDVATIAAQVSSLISAGVESICVHSDSPDAAAIGIAVVEQIRKMGAGPKRFVA